MHAYLVALAGQHLRAGGAEAHVAAGVHGDDPWVREADDAFHRVGV